MHHAQLHMQQYRTQVVIVILEKITSVGRRPGQAIVYCYLDQRKVRKNRIDQSEMSMLDGIPSFHHTFVKPDHLGRDWMTSPPSLARSSAAWPLLASSTSARPDRNEIESRIWRARPSSTKDTFTDARRAPARQPIN
jgi:hypothetical protein